MELLVASPLPRATFAATVLAGLSCTCTREKRLQVPSGPDRWFFGRRRTARRLQPRTALDKAIWSPKRTRFGAKAWEYRDICAQVDCKRRKALSSKHVQRPAGRFMSYQSAAIARAIYSGATHARQRPSLKSPKSGAFDVHSPPPSASASALPSRPPVSALCSFLVKGTRRSCSSGYPSPNSAWYALHPINVFHSFPLTIIQPIPPPCKRPPLLQPRYTSPVTSGTWTAGRVVQASLSPLQKR